MAKERQPSIFGVPLESELQQTFVFSPRFFFFSRAMNASSSPPLAAPPENRASLLGKRPVAFSADEDCEANRNVSSLLSSEGSSTAQPKAEPVQCYVCGRQFGTWKALFGHMRCHPEREWRGVRPLAGGEGSGAGRRKWRRAPEEMKQVEERRDESMQYACGECTRVFGTRQALGGHRASHRGVMGCSAKAKDTKAPAAAAPAVKGGAREAGGVEKYVCRECERQFATYHGMRIHQRVHRQGEKNGQGGDAAAEAAEESRRGESGRGSMLDLNLPPPPE